MIVKKINKWCIDIVNWQLFYERKKMLKREWFWDADSI